MKRNINISAKHLLQNSKNYAKKLLQFIKLWGRPPTPKTAEIVWGLR